MHSNSRNSLTDRVVAITGGATGIGFSTAERCAAAGARIAIIDLSPERGASAVKALRDQGYTANFYCADVTDEAQISKAISDAEQDLGPVTGLVNNAGIAGFGSVHEAKLSDWDRIMAVNVTGTFLASKAAIPSMIKRGYGSIVNFGSVAGMVGIPTMAAYCAAKGAVVNLTRQMAADYSGKGIRVNAVCPGTVASTDMGHQLLGSDSSPEVQARRLAKYPIGRFGEPGDIAAAVLFLLSDEAAFVTGSAFAVDGGMTAI
ncbi:SDR family NAD(P)-dependent oxidoreductase [Methylocaldum sp.]|uniref:SDR family NAD(P)-dependent oxidoreductase n=1 Tax=Methylocaldum sp. TaxID=1969727 RepID=UPI002D29E57E|nr:SDR family NAD(P)-dependent oxidoreductase [Methylocaldum sp.]HYE34326.1 SDR family NAD(P)-dependent oxidoreductase [Methylocaldum sp.]